MNSASSGTGLSYGLYLGAGAATVTNSGSITAGTAGIYAGAAITTLRNYQGGSGTSPGTRALTYSGALPTNYYIYVSSATHYGQIQFTNPTGSMAVVVDSGSLALGTYQNVMQGVAASAFTGGSGSLGLMKWALSLSNPTSLAWDLVVTPVGVDPNTTKVTSNLGTTFLPIFTGGTLQVDQTAHTYTSTTVDLTLVNGLDSANTARALTANGANLRNLLVQRTAALAGMMDYDCATFDSYGVCLSFQARYSGMETLNEGAGVLTAAYRLSPNLRLTAASIPPKFWSHPKSTITTSSMAQEE